MKKDIHPTYHKEVVVTCSCGHSFTTGSTAKELTVEVCAHCHPFYTGTQKLVDTAGRVDRFKKRMTRVRKQPTKSRTSKRRKKLSGSAGTTVSLNKAR